MYSLAGYFSLLQSMSRLSQAWDWGASTLRQNPADISLLELMPLRIHPDKGEERPIWWEHSNHAECPLCPLLAVCLPPLGWAPVPSAGFPQHRAWRPHGADPPAALLASRGSAVVVFGSRRDVDAVADAWSAIPDQTLDIPTGDLGRLLRLAAAPAPDPLAEALNAVGSAIAQLGGRSWPVLTAFHYWLTAAAAGAPGQPGDEEWTNRLMRRLVWEIVIE